MKWKKKMNYIIRNNRTLITTDKVSYIKNKYTIFRRGHCHGFYIIVVLWLIIRNFSIFNADYIFFEIFHKIYKII